VSNEFITREDLVRVSQARTVDRLQMSCEHVFELRPKTIVKLSAVRTNQGRLFQTVGTQHENRRAAMFNG